MNTTIEDYTLPDLDINYLSYQKLKQDENWLQEHLGYYVAFVDGELVAKDKDRKNLLSQARKIFTEKSRFVTKVELEERVIDMREY